MRVMTTGLMLGAAAGMFIVPQLDRSTKRRIRRTGKMMRNSAVDMYDNLKGWMK